LLSRVASLMASDICPSISRRDVEIVGGNRFTSRLPGEERGRITARLVIQLSVVSDYLFIGSGREHLHELEKLAKDQGLLRLPPEELIRRVSHALRGSGVIKDFFRVFNPFTGRVQPAIPGSSLKGAARSRLELASSGDRVVAGFLYPGSSVAPLQSLPRPGMHGWRHARIWCESVAEARRKPTSSPISVEDDLFGSVLREIDLVLSSRVSFATLYPVDPGLDCRVVSLDHGERVCAVERGAVFRGEVLAVNVSKEELGLLLYSLGQDKLLCGKEPLLLMGASKYRCRVANNKRVSFGVVKLDVESIDTGPWGGQLGGNVDSIVRDALNQAFSAYPGLRKCFDEAERRLRLEPC